MSKELVFWTFPKHVSVIKVSSYQFIITVFPFLQLPALKNETDNSPDEHSQVDPTYTEYYYPKPRSYLGSSYDITRPKTASETLVPIGKNDVEYPKLVTEPPRKYSNPFDSVQIRPRAHAAVTKEISDKDDKKEGFIAQNGKQVDPDEDKTPVDQTLLSAESKVSQVRAGFWSIVLIRSLSGDI